MLTFIFQQSLDSGAVPDDWKVALVTPIFKKGKRSAPENYRPVSLTSICCKIKEHIIVSETIKHLEHHNILVDYQHGFRRRRSCESQLLITAHDFASILNKHSQVDVAVLDFAKAFDKVPHQRLIEKMKFYNIHPSVVEWTKAFLSSRTQSVVVDGYTSEAAPVLSGVPQGTVMGPLLFLIFINDIAKEIGASVRLFADDCLLYREIKSTKDCSLLQKDLTELVNWSKTWGMAFNIAKCSILSLTNATKNKISYTYEMDDQALTTIKSTPYLGVTISRKLQWTEHIDATVFAANRMLGFLRRTLGRCPENIKEKAYKATVRPKLEYCSSVWDPHHQTDIEKIEKVQKRAARFVKNIPHRRSGPQPSVTAIVEDLGWETLQNRRLNNQLTLLYKTVNNQIEIPAEYHPVPNNTRESRRCHNHQFTRLQSDINVHKYSFIPRTITDWNKLPSDVVAAKSLDLFKKRLHARQF